MNICIFQSIYAGSQPEHVTKEYDDHILRPGNFTDAHSFQDRWISKTNAKKEIDAAVAEGFDVYFNFMWGQLEDDVAGIEAVRYLESLGVPVMGMPSRILERSKLDFYRDAKTGGIRIPETSRYPTTFPVFVKPARGCSSVHLDEKSVCWNQKELEVQVARLKEKLASGRKSTVKTTSGSYSRIKQEDDDIVVQQFIDGHDYSVIIIEVMNTPIPLNPTKYEYPKEVGKNTFLTFDVKFHKETKEVLLQRDENPELYDKLQKLAVDMWKANKMDGGNWANMDIRVQYSNGEAVGIEVNPMPAMFVAIGQCEDIVAEVFPGGHRAVIDILIETTLERHSQKAKALAKDIAATYDAFATTYDRAMGDPHVGGKHEDSFTRLVQANNFTGAILDLACGTGFFPRICHKVAGSKRLTESTFYGIDISAGMVKMAQLNGIPLYENVHIGLIQDVLPTLEKKFDHILAIGVLYHLSPTQLSVVLSRMFQLATKSITFTIEQLSDAYNEGARKHNEGHMAGTNHTKACEAFSLPKGWKRVPTAEFDFSWASKHFGAVTTTKVYRFVFE